MAELGIGHQLPPSLQSNIAITSVAGALNLASLGIISIPAH